MQCLPHKDCAKVTVLVANHNCASHALVVQAQASRIDWLQQVVPTILTVDSKTTSNVTAPKKCYSREGSFVDCTNRRY
jgi:hypothetical protein